MVNTILLSVIGFLVIVMFFINMITADTIEEELTEVINWSYKDLHEDMQKIQKSLQAKTTKKQSKKK